MREGNISSNAVVEAEKVMVPKLRRTNSSSTIIGLLMAFGSASPSG